MVYPLLSPACLGNIWFGVVSGLACPLKAFRKKRSSLDIDIIICGKLAKVSFSPSAKLNDFSSYPPGGEI